MHQPLKTEISELEKSKLDVLLKEYELVNTKIEKFVGNQFLYTQGALVLAGGYVFFLVEGLAVIDKAVDIDIDTKLYLQFLPFIILMIMTAVLYQYQRTIGLQGYKHYLERTINGMVGQNLISYGHIGIKYMLKKNWVAFLNSLLYAIIYLSACYLVYDKTKDARIPWWFIVHCSVFVVYLVFALVQTSGYTDKVCRIAEKLSKSKKDLTSFDELIKKEKKLQKLKKRKKK